MCAFCLPLADTSQKLVYTNFYDDSNDLFSVEDSSSGARSAAQLRQVEGCSAASYKTSYKFLVALLP